MKKIALLFLSLFIVGTVSADDCLDNTKYVKETSGVCSGSSDNKVNISACIKQRGTGEPVELATIYNEQTTKGDYADLNGCFTMKDVPENSVLRITQVEVFEARICASEFKDKKLVCMNEEKELEEIAVIACPMEVLNKLNAYEGKQVNEGGVMYCDIVCAPGVEKQAKVQNFKYKLSTGEEKTIFAKYTCGTSASVACQPAVSNAKSGILLNGECIVTECIAPYSVSPDSRSCVMINNTSKLQEQELARKKISSAMTVLESFASSAKVSVWKNEEGKFNSARLVSDSIAGVVLGTAGGLISNRVIKKNQIENGIEGIRCVVGEQMVAEYGDQFMVGMQ